MSHALHQVNVGPHPDRDRIPPSAPTCFPASFRPFAAFEEIATALRSFEHTLVPGLLQTPKYARAVLAIRPNTSPDELDDMVAARLARQAILDRDDPPRYGP